MSTTTKQGSRTDRVIKYDDFVDRELARIRSHVKLSDIARHLMTLAAACLGLLMLLVLFDHWVGDLGLWGRCAGLAALIGVVAYFLVRRVVPEMLRSINPAYAAVLAERSEPALKSSLINFVMLRPKRDHLREVVYREVEQQAAQRLSQVELESAVDQTPLIRVCLALLLTLCVFAGYTFMSPKSPFQTLARIFRPLGDIARPTRVQIGDVKPGDVSVYAGRHVAVSAVVDRPDDPADVWLIYSTPDGQFSDRRLPMFLDESGLRHTGSLPEGSQGIERDIDYRIVSGDAVAGPFRIRVSPSPTIFVEEIRYEPPAYTGLAAETTRDGGDIRGVEGTRVTVVARANQDIRHARIEFDPDLAGNDRPLADTRRTMKHEGRTATATFVLELKEDRKTPLHQAYQLRFTSQDGQTNEECVPYPIVVMPDLPPLVDILMPDRLRVRVPIDARQLIQLRALDPDYGLADVRLQAVVNNTKLLDEPLLTDAPAQGARRLEYVFRPQALGLKVGDVVLYRGQAKDTRRDALDSAAAANSAITPWHAVQVVARDAPGGSSAKQPGLSPDEPPGDTGDDSEDSSGDQAAENANGDESTRQQGTTGEGNEAGDGEGEPQDTGGESTSEMSDDASQASDQGGDAGSEETGAGDPSGSPETGETGPEGPAPPGTEETESGDKEGGPGNQGGAESADRGEEPGDGQDANDGQPAGEQANGKNTGGGQPGGQSSQAGEPPQEADESGDAGEGSSTNEIGPDGKTAGDNRPADGRAEGGATGDGATGESEADGESQEPLASDGSEDPDAFDRILEHMKEKFGERPDGTPQPAPSEETGDPKSSAARQADDTTSDEVEPTEQTPPAEQPTAGEQGDRREPEPGGDSLAAGEEGAGGREGTEAAGEEAGGDEKAAGSEGEEPSGGRGEDQGESGQSESGQSESGQSESGQSESGQSESGQGESGEGESGEGESGEGESGEGESGEGESGEGESGEGAPGESMSGKGSESKPAADSSSNESRESPPEGASSENTPSAEGGQPSSPPSGGAPAGSGAGRPQSAEGAQSAEDRGERGSGETGSEPGGTDPNLEYARKATDMVLDYLKDQEDHRELLDRLGWTPAQMEEFLARWDQLRREAKPSGQEEVAQPSAWNEALRSLGLHPGRDKLRGAGKRVDANNNVTDAGTRSPPPAEYAEQYEAYLKGLGGAQDAP